MLKLKQLKQQQDQQKRDAANGIKRVSPAQLRVQKDLTELDLPKSMKTEFPDPSDLMNFQLLITPEEGFYKGGKFKFSFTINPNFPHEPPKVKCLQTIYHPNIDTDGNVCLNILREDWKPILTLGAVMVGLQFLFLEPNPNDPLNKEAAEEMASNGAAFAKRVKMTMGGGILRNIDYDRVV